MHKADVRRKNMTYQEKYQFWLDAPYFDEKTKEELRALDAQ